VRFHADECLDRKIVDALITLGADVTSASALAPGAIDEAVLELSLQGDRVLITEDKDFGALVFRDRRASAGIVLVRLDKITDVVAADIAARIFALPNFGRDAFTTLDLDGVRSRDLA